MGRPSKAEVEKREKIKELGLFVRDSDIYTVFEKETEEMSTAESSYVFSVECGYRNTRCKTSTFGEFNETYLNLSGLMKTLDRSMFQGYFTPFIQNMEKLHSIDIEIFVFFFELIKHSKYATFSQEKPFDYKVINLVYLKDFIDILGEERAKELFIGLNATIDLNTIIYDEEKLIQFKHIFPDSKCDDSKYFLSKEELNKVRNFYFSTPQDSYRITPHSTLIKRDYHAYGTTLDSHKVETPPEGFYIDYGTTKTKSAYVELDFTKPIEELKEFITKIKDDFDNEHRSIRNIYDLLGDKNDIFQCDLKDCDIYKTNNIKPIGGRLSDVLFIYDCKKAGLDNDYIIDEINRYWIDIKNLFREKFRASTLIEYHNLAIDYIDNEKYECYLSGYDIKA